MNKIKYALVNDVIYQEKLSNGLNVFMLPKKDFNSTYVTFTTKYGGMYNTFIPIGKKEMITVPNGIAHFLEHKMFEQESGEDPFTFYTKKGFNCNAFTSSKITSYLFSGTGDITDATKYLLDYVQSPYFTDENVEKEKGIIEEEIKMYEDYPSVVCYYGLLENIFKNNPIKINVAGRVSDIKKITKEDLYTCYNTFYHPSNMILVITGNFNLQETLKIVKENQESKSFSNEFNIKISEINEPDKVCKTYEEREMGIDVPKILYGIKLKRITIENNYKRLLYLSIFINSLFDASSDFYENVLNENKVVDFINTEILNAKSHDVIIINAESTKPNEFIKEVDEYLKKATVSKEMFERQKKVLYSTMLTSFDDIYSLNDLITHDMLDYNEIIPNKLELINKLSYEEFLKLIKTLDLTNVSSFVIK